MEHISLKIPVNSDEESDLLTAHLISMGFQGFEEQAGMLIACLPAAEYEQEAVEKLLHDLGKAFQTEYHKPVNWNAEWESSFQPVAINSPGDEKPFAMIRADFHPLSPGFKYDLIIHPKMSFGTGHHATTYLMVQAMSEIDFRGKKVIDFGTGTGVLAILAAKMGAEDILALDCDEWSIENAAENFEKNQITNIKLLLEDVFPSNVKADIILANINRNIIEENLPAIINALEPGGIVLISGILEEDELKLISILNPKNNDNLMIRRKGLWLLIRMKSD